MVLRLITSPRFQLMRLSCVIGILLLTFCMTDNAFAQKSLLQLPFRINVVFNGSYDDSTQSSDTSIQSRHDTFVYNRSHSFMIDSSVAGSILTIAGDSLIYFDSNYTPGFYDGWTVEQADIHFDTIFGVITSLSLATSEQHDDETEPNTRDEANWRLKCLNIPYFEDSIGSFDSINSSDILDLYDDTSVVHQNDVPPYNGYTWESRLISGQARLSGSTIANSSVSESSSSTGFNAIFENQQLECTFEPSSDERVLRVYSILGVEIQRMSIDPGQNIIVVPHFESGLYFLSLEHSFLPIYIPD